MPNEITTEPKQLKCPSCGGEKMMRVHIMEHSDNKRRLLTDDRYRTLKPHDINVQTLDANRFENKYSMFTQEQLDAMPISKFVCEDCGIIIDRIDPEIFRRTWEEATEYKYKPMKHYRGILEEWCVDYDITILHHTNDRDAYFHDFITELNARGLSVGYENANWTELEFVDDLLKLKEYGPYKKNPFNVWNCRICILLISDTLFKHIQRNHEGFCKKLRTSLFNPNRFQMDHKSYQWIFPVSIGINFEDLEAAGLLDDKTLFRKLDRENMKGLAEELSNYIISTCKHRPKHDNQNKLPS
jgi:predicted RNA-binding Zn-ribbon protein involved in translation (DUF1610 family)